MSTFDLALMSLLGLLGGYAGWVTRAYIAHLLNDNDRLWKTADRGTKTAERAVAIVDPE